MDGLSYNFHNRSLSKSWSYELPLFNLHILIGMVMCTQSGLTAKPSLAGLHCSKGSWGPKGDDFLSHVTQLNKHMGN